MKVWRSGTSECSAASARASSSDGRMSIASAATGIQHLVGVAEREVARCEQHGQVVEHVGHLLCNALVGLLASGARHLLGLLLDLLADERRLGQQLRRPAALAWIGAAVFDNALECRQRLVRRRVLAVLEETGALAGVACRARRLDQRQQRVGVAVPAQLAHALDVAGGLALVPELLARAAPEPGLTGLA